jgi:flagellar biosynthetic protein FliR
LSVLIMGLISRTLPQLNILAIGFSFNAIVTLVILSVSIGAAAWLFQDEAVIAIESIQDALSSSPPRPKS